MTARRPHPRVDTTGYAATLAAAPAAMHAARTHVIVSAVSALVAGSGDLQVASASPDVAAGCPDRSTGLRSPASVELATRFHGVGDLEWGDDERLSAVRLDQAMIRREARIDEPVVLTVAQTAFRRPREKHTGVLGVYGRRADLFDDATSVWEWWCVPGR